MQASMIASRLIREIWPFSAMNTKRAASSVVDPYRLGIAGPGADPFQCLHDVFAAVRKPRIGHRAEAGMRVDDLAPTPTWEWHFVVAKG